MGDLHYRKPKGNLSIEKRVDGNASKVVRDLELFGWNYVCDEVLHCSPDALQRWYQRQPDCENRSIYTLKPRFSTSAGMSLGEQIVAAIKVDRARDEVEKAELQTKIKERDERIKFLEWQLNIKGRDNRGEVSLIVEACEI